MEQHPIPQQISSYQFRLVGDMTLKQFFQLAGGALVSLLFYASPLHPLIKWPFILFFALLGVALAFLPFEERPLEKWIIAFFRSIYSPTLFYWQKTQTPPVFFQEEAPTPTERFVAPQGEEALKNYLSSSGPKSPFLSALESAEQSFLSKITPLFGGVFTTTPPSAAIGQPSGSGKQKQELTIPTTEPTLMPVALRPKVIVEEGAPEAQPAGAGVTTTGVAPTVGSYGPISGQEAQFSPEAAPPLPPTTPNTIVGQILDETGKIIEGAILEIRDAAGRPVRALKSNKLGHFMIVTPLMNGRYEVIIEKEGFAFEHIVFEASGEIIPPIILRAKARPQAIISEQGLTAHAPLTN